MLIIVLSLFPKNQLYRILHLRKYCVVGSWEIKKDLLLALVFQVFITSSRLVSTSIALHTSFIWKMVHFALEKIQCSWPCNWLLGNRAIPIISTCFPCFYHNFTSCININSFACTINIEKNVHFYLRKTWKTSTNNKSFIVSQEPTAKYLHLRKYGAMVLGK